MSKKIKKHVYNRQKRKDISEVEIEYFNFLQISLKEYFHNINKQIYNYDYNGISEKMRNLTFDYWANYFSMLDNNVRDIEINRFIESFKAFIMNIIRKENHTIEGRDETLH